MALRPLSLSKALGSNGLGLETIKNVGLQRSGMQARPCLALPVVVCGDGALSASCNGPSGSFSGDDARRLGRRQAQVVVAEAGRGKREAPAADVADDEPSPSRASSRQKALEAAMADINSSFGKGSVTRLGSAGGAIVETFPSGCLTLDFALGGGLPKGRIVEIYGPESSGKTTLALHAIAAIQKSGGNAMLVDAEHAFDPDYSRALGVDVENLIVCQPDNGEMALETADRMCRSGAVDLICIDSVSALTPRAEIEGEIGMQQIGLQARLMSQALRKMSANASRAGCTLIFINQIRYKVGVMYGNPEITSGGLALKFFASLRLEIRSAGKIKSPKGEDDVGIRARVRVQKSKVSRPYKQAEFDIIFGEGICTRGCILDCAESVGVILKKGSWYSFGDTRLGQGRDRVVQFLRENPEICDNIEKLVRSRTSEELQAKKDAVNGASWTSVAAESDTEDEDFVTEDEDVEVLVDF